MLRRDVSASRNKSEYEDILDAEEDGNEAKESGDERGEVEGFSCGNSTAMVPPKEGRLVSPHMVDGCRCKVDDREVNTIQGVSDVMI